MELELEVIQLSKIEKSTDKGIVNVHKATLKGTATVKSPNSGETVAVTAKVTLECEDEESALDNFIHQAIGDKRILTLSPVNRTLEQFQTE